MTNFEKYKDKIKELDCGFNFKVDKNTYEVKKCDRDCNYCLFFNFTETDCNKLSFNWLCEEYMDHLTADSMNILKMFGYKYKYVVRIKSWLEFIAEKDRPKRQIDYSMFDENIVKINFDILEEGKYYPIKALIGE